MVRQVIACIGALCLIGVQWVFAAEPDKALQPIIVKSAATEITASQIDLARYNGFARVINRQDFDGRFVSLSDLLDSQLGVQVRQLGGWGGYAEISVRASTSKQMALFVDGVPFTSAQSAGLNLNLIPLTVIERIEIFPDFIPVQLASSNIGGAINVVTRNLAQDQAQVGLRAGSFGAQGATAAWFVGGDDTRLAAAAEWLSADNDYAFLNEGNTPDNPANHFRDRRFNNGYRQGSGFLKGGYAWSNTSDIQWFINHVNVVKDIPTINNRPADEASLATKLSQARVALSTRYGQWQVDHGVSLSQDKMVFDDPRMQFMGSFGFAESSNIRVNTRHVAYLDQGQHRLSMAVEVQRESFGKNSSSEKLSYIENYRLSAIFAVQDDSQWLDERLVFTLMGRGYWIGDETRQKPIFNEPGYYEKDQFQGQSWHAGLRYALSEQVLWKFNVANAIRIPTLFERFGETGSIRPNDELKPERSLNLELGLTADWRAWSLFAAVFHKHGKDHIVLNIDTSGRGKLLNMGKTETRGSEARVDWKLMDGWQLSSGMVLLETENQVNVKAFRGKPLSGIYHRQGFAQLQWATPGHRMQLSWRHDSDLIYDPAGTARAKPKNQWDLGISGYWHAWTASITINNLLDRQAKDFNRFQNAGQAFYLSLTYDGQ